MVFSRQEMLINKLMGQQYASINYSVMHMMEQLV